ncbi:MAG: hypothetical protein HOC74_10150 [Gemmatimonadetes bacterium]|nr:hypothetical protein [Gemmatimonadota bacterium]
MPDGAVTIDLGQNKSAVDLSGKQYYAVRLDETSGQARLAVTASVNAGILQNKPVTGRPAAIRVFGESFGVCSGAVTAMDRLAPDDSGHLVVSTTDTDEVIAFAIEAGGTAGASSILNVVAIGPQTIAG